MKDRLAELQRNIEKGSSLSELHDRLNVEEGDANEDTELLSTDHWNSVETFLSKVNAVVNDLVRMETLLEEIKMSHEQRIIEPDVHPQFTADLNRAMEAFKEKSYSTQATVKQMNAEVDRLTVGDKKDVSVSGVDARIKRDQMMALTRRFHNVLLSFNDEQMKYKEKCKQKISSYLTVSGQSLPEEDIDKAIETGQLFDYTKGLVLAYQDKKALYDDVKGRHDDIVRLEASVRELHELFQQLSTSLEQQNDMLNHIERNVESAVDYANKAFRNVKQAKQLQAKTIKKKICLLILIAVVIILLLMIGSVAFCSFVPFVCRR